MILKMEKYLKKKRQNHNSLFKSENEQSLTLLTHENNHSPYLETHTYSNRRTDFDYTIQI